MKKFLAFTLSMIWMFTLGVYSSAEDEVVDNYQFLINKGYDGEYLNCLSENTMQRMVELIGDSDVSNVEIKETTFNYNNSVMRGNINPDNLTLDISIGTICQNGSNVIAGIIVGVTWEWGSFDPWYRGKDAITVNWDEDLFIFSEGSFYAEDAYRHDDDDDWITSNSYSVLSAANQGGIGHYTDLEEWTEFVSGAMIFLLEPTSYMTNGNTYTTSINVEYAHEKSALTGLSFSLGDVGVGISWNVSCDTMADTKTFRYSR